MKSLHLYANVKTLGSQAVIDVYGNNRLLLDNIDFQWESETHLAFEVVFHMLFSVSFMLNRNYQWDIIYVETPHPIVLGVLNRHWGMAKKAHKHSEVCFRMVDQLKAKGVSVLFCEPLAERQASIKPIEPTPRAEIGALYNDFYDARPDSVSIQKQIKLFKTEELAPKIQLALGGLAIIFFVFIKGCS